MYDSNTDLSSELQVSKSNCLLYISNFNIMSKIIPQTFSLSPAILLT